jgi:large subunit ribosomal protein L15
MQINNLTSNNKKKTIIGRGGKRGKTSGRGTKGQGARAGNKKRPEFRDILKKLPKLRGYKFNSYQAKATVVTFEFIEKNFNAGDVVNLLTLSQKGVKAWNKHELKLVKILNRGTLTKKLTFEKCTVSKAAEKAIVALGGQVL